MLSYLSRTLPINVTSGIKGTKCRKQTTKLIQTDEPYCEQAATWELHLLLYGTTYSTLSTVEYLLLSDIMFSCGDSLSLSFRHLNAPFIHSKNLLISFLNDTILHEQVYGLWTAKLQHIRRHPIPTPELGMETWE